MKKYLKNKNGFSYRNFISDGFTLIELLVVIAIIGILASISLVSFDRVQKQARDTQRKSDLKQYQSSLEAYANNYSGLFPSYSAIPASSTLCTKLALSTCPGPEDPTYEDADDTPYQYKSDGSVSNGTKSDAPNYVLWAKLESKTDTYWVICSSGKSGESASVPALPCPW